MYCNGYCPILVKTKMSSMPVKKLRLCAVGGRRGTVAQGRDPADILGEALQWRGSHPGRRRTEEAEDRLGPVLPRERQRIRAVRSQLSQRRPVRTDIALGNALHRTIMRLRQVRS